MIFKGDPFVNRYRIEGKLIAITPTHVGTGEVLSKPREVKKIKDSNKVETQDIALIARGFNSLPYLPGSAVRGTIRHYLLQVFRSFKGKVAADPDFESEKFRNYEEKDQINYMMRDASLLEQLFGTPFSEGKIEFWDASATNIDNAPNYVERGWDQKRQSYIVQSVSIDPETGAADPHKLYAFEVAPPGLQYHINIVGQNLTDEELGFLVFGLNGFNSEIFPLTIGAMSGRGFGRMKFELKNIYCITRSEIKNWASLALTNDHAGYNLLPKVKEPADQLIQKFKDAFQKRMTVQS